MPYIYNSSALLSASVSDNLQPITLPPVNRYAYPWGIDLMGGSSTGNLSRHTATKCIQFVPIKFAAGLSIDRIGLMFADAGSTVDTWTYDLGLYSNTTADNYPNALITNFGTLSYTGGVTANGPQLITINQALAANTTYWLGVGINVSGTTDTGLGRTPYLYQLQGDFAMFRKRGISAANSGALGMAWAHSLGSYAGTLPASVTYAANSASLPTALRVAVRRSA
jgi:hypothetical protein